MKLLLTIILCGLIQLVYAYNKVEGLNFDIIRDEDFMKSYNTSVQLTKNQETIYITLKPKTVFITVTKTIPFVQSITSTKTSSFPEGYRTLSSNEQKMVTSRFQSFTTRDKKPTAGLNIINTNTLSQNNTKNIAKTNILQTSTQGGLGFNVSTVKNVIRPKATLYSHPTNYENIADNFIFSNRDDDHISLTQEAKSYSIDQTLNFEATSYVSYRSEDNLHMGDRDEGNMYRRDSNISSSSRSSPYFNQSNEINNADASTSYDYLPDSEIDFSNGAATIKIGGDFIPNAVIYFFAISLLVFTFSL